MCVLGPCMHMRQFLKTEFQSAEYLEEEGIMDVPLGKDFSTKINHSLSWVRFLLMTVFKYKGCHGLGSWFHARHVTCSYCYKPMPLSRLYLLYFVCIDSFEWNKSWHKLYKRYKFPKDCILLWFFPSTHRSYPPFFVLCISVEEDQKFCKLWKELMKMNHFLILLSSEDK